MLICVNLYFNKLGATRLVARAVIYAGKSMVLILYKARRGRNV